MAQEVKVELMEIDEKEKSTDWQSHLPSDDPTLAFRDGLLETISCLSAGVGYKTAESEHQKSTSETAVHNLIESWRRLEIEFDRETLFWSIHKPDLVIKEEIKGMKTDLNRKTELCSKVTQDMNRLLAAVGGRPRPNVQFQPPAYVNPPVRTGIEPSGSTQQWPSRGFVPMEPPNPGGGSVQFRGTTSQ